MVSDSSVTIRLCEAVVGYLVGRREQYSRFRLDPQLRAPQQVGLSPWWVECKTAQLVKNMNAKLVPVS